MHINYKISPTLFRSSYIMKSQALLYRAIPDHYKVLITKRKHFFMLIFGRTNFNFVKKISLFETL